MEGGQYTLVKETAGNEAPIKNPNTSPIRVAIISLALSFDFFRAPLQKKEKLFRHFREAGKYRIARKPRKSGSHFEVVYHIKNKNFKCTIKLYLRCVVPITVFCPKINSKGCSPSNNSIPRATRQDNIAFFSFTRANDDSKVVALNTRQWTGIYSLHRAAAKSCEHHCNMHKRSRVAFICNDTTRQEFQTHHSSSQYKRT